MPRTRRSLFALTAAAALALCTWPAGEAAPSRPAQNAILVMTDGLRWQDVFRGADPALLNKENGAVENVPALKARYWRESVTERRAALLPFLWTKVAQDGQVWGNRDLGSFASVTNRKNFSYPGYNETLTGFPDDRIDSNDKKHNPNVTVFEWLNGRDRYRGRVAAFAAWDVFPFIFNAPRAGFPVNAGFDPLEGTGSPTIDLLNRLKAETPSPWPGTEPYDSLTFRTALEYLKARKPRVLYLSLGETDEWAHAGKYGEYLDAAHRVDSSLRELWETLQSMREYRGNTAILVTTDHGRGEAPTGWRSHGAQIQGSENIWLAALGSGIAPAGERRGGTAITQSQVAATLARLLGEDYNAAQPKAGAPIEELFRR